LEPTGGEGGADACGVGVGADRDSVEGGGGGVGGGSPAGWGGVRRRRRLLWAATVRAVEERRKKVNVAGVMGIKSLMSDGLFGNRRI
jgi:hypothetical protein